MKILQINKAYYPHIGGIESLVRTFSRELNRREDLTVQVLVCQDKPAGRRNRIIEGVRVCYARTLGVFASCPVSLDFFRQFMRYARQADVIECHMPFPLADLAVLLSGYRGAVVLAWHSDVVRQKKLLFFYKPILRRFLRRADCIIAATPGHIDSSPYLREFREKCRIIPYGIHTANYHTVPAHPVLRAAQRVQGTVRLLFVGRFVYYKGIEVLLEAFGKTTGSELFLVGHGTPEMEQRLRQLAQRSGKLRDVHFMGSLSDRMLRSAFADCDLFVLPSVENSEAFGIVQLEAMACGKPVINTALPTGVPYVSLHKQTGLTVPPGDASALAAAIQVLTDDLALRVRYGKNARARVRAHFEEKEIVEQVEEVLVQAAKSRKR